MLTLRRPTSAALAALVESNRRLPLSYREGLLHRESTEHHWFVDRHREIVGNGHTDFASACEALRQWEQFRRSWAVAAQPPAPIKTGETVGYSARALGVWWSYCCRIIDTFESHEDSMSRFGFDYGTTRGHAERGEERFVIDFDHTTGCVTIELFAMSRPGRWFMWFGLPLGRRLQAKFRREIGGTIRAFIAKQASTT